MDALQSAWARVIKRQHLSGTKASDTISQTVKSLSNCNDVGALEQSCHDLHKVSQVQKDTHVLLSKVNRSVQDCFPSSVSQLSFPIA
ncbi:hypothetical protein GEMRC1_004650 [Eukaryota sp. GEM-RC1]